mmetsp:Transcript_11038/g.45830  ORF Transcript_11038/g.45830 Transcript_11038/m.45830 type:complete len:206 (+) Transcript_11038:866-1483(+)
MRRSAFGIGSSSSAVATSSTDLFASAAAPPSASASSISNSSAGPASAAVPPAPPSAAAAAPSGAGGGSRYESSTVPSTSCLKHAMTRAPRLASCVGWPDAPAGGTSAWKRRRSSMHGAKSRASSKTSCMAFAVAASFWPTSSWQLNASTGRPTAAPAAMAVIRLPTPAPPVSSTLARRLSGAAPPCTAGAIMVARRRHGRPDTSA